MRSPLHALKKVILACGLALTTPLLAHGECIAMPRTPNPLGGAKLAFMGTVTKTDIDTFGVWFQVNRVWKGRLHRDTTLAITPTLEGATVKAFQTGEEYLVFVYQP